MLTKINFVSFLYLFLQEQWNLVLIFISFVSIQQYTAVQANDDEFIGQTIEYLIQDDDFHQIVVLTDRPIHNLQKYNQDENKEIVNLYFKELNENILNIIVYEILDDLHIHTVVLMVEDALWKMVQQHIQTHIEKPIFWIRLIHSVAPLKETTGDFCQFQLASFELEKATNRSV